MSLSLNQFFSEKNNRRISWLLGMFSILVVALLYYSQNPFLEAFEAKTYDLRFKSLRGEVAVAPEIAIIAIDEKSVAELGRFPWTRTQYVKLLERTTRAGAKAVLFDALFPERESAAADAAFAAAIKRAGNVVLAVSFDYDAEFKVVGQTRSLHEMERNAAGVAHINFLPENDGINRRNRLVVEQDGKMIPSLGLAAAMTALGVKKIEVNAFDIGLGEHAVPVGEGNAMWINFTGGPGNYPRYSFTDVVHGRVPAQELKGKILFVGATALGIYDMRVTPFSGNTPGVEVHAAVADNIISERYVRQGAVEALLDILFIVVVGALAYFTTTRLRLYQALPAVLLLVGIYIWIDYEFFLAGHWVSMIYPSLAAIVSLLIGGSFRYLVLERNAREMRSMFSSYLSDKLVAQLEKDPEAAKIGGDSKEVTVLFTDIRGFTSFSEQHTPQEVVARLNQYLAEMVQIIQRHDGTIDKFIGDGIMVYWGAPLAQPDHAKQALQCVAEIKAKMRELRLQWNKDGQEPFYIRGGLQSGEVVAGNIGIRGKKMEYTVIGDVVNQASRLESTAKFYGVSFLVGERTWQLSKDAVRYRELDKIRVVGKQHPVTIYEPYMNLSIDDGIMLERFAKALALYREHRWDDAAQAFTALSRDFPDDVPCKIYIERSTYFTQSPPPSDWDGVFNRDEK